MHGSFRHLCKLQLIIAQYACCFYFLLLEFIIFIVTDLNGYVMELMGAKGEICNFLPIARKLKMPKSLIDQVLKSWKNEDQQLELMLQYWLKENEVLDDHQALRKDLEDLQHGKLT